LGLQVLTFVSEAGDESCAAEVELVQRPVQGGVVDRGLSAAARGAWR
jgi:hypothetical protein